MNYGQILLLILLWTKTGLMRGKDQLDQARLSISIQKIINIQLIFQATVVEEDITKLMELEVTQIMIIHKMMTDLEQQKN